MTYMTHPTSYPQKVEKIHLKFTEYCVQLVHFFFNIYGMIRFYIFFLLPFPVKPFVVYNLFQWKHKMLSAVKLPAFGEYFVGNVSKFNNLL